MCFLESECLQKIIINKHNNEAFKHTMGRINRSYFGGLRVNPSPTYVTLVTILFHAFPTQNRYLIHPMLNYMFCTSCFSSSNDFENLIFSNCTDFGDWNTPLALFQLTSY